MSKSGPRLASQRNVVKSARRLWTVGRLIGSFASKLWVDDGPYGSNRAVVEERKFTHPGPEKSPVVFTRGVSVFHVLRGTKAVPGGL